MTARVIARRSPAAFGLIYGEALVAHLCRLGHDPQGFALAQSRAAMDTLSASVGLPPETASAERLRVAAIVREHYGIAALRAGVRPGSSDGSPYEDLSASQEEVAA